MTDQTQSASATEEEYPSSTYGWYVVVILTLAYIVSFLDRQILNLMVEPIKADLGHQRYHDEPVAGFGLWDFLYHFGHSHRTFGGPV